METIKISGTRQFPDVVLDKENGRFEFSGNSLPENAKLFYDPIINWIDNYSTQPNPETTVRFKMVYFNTPSSKMLFQILKRFETLALGGHKTTIVWAYNDDDLDIKEAGRVFSGHIKVPFIFESYRE